MVSFRSSIGQDRLGQRSILYSASFFMPHGREKSRSARHASVYGLFPALREGLGSRSIRGLPAHKAASENPGDP
jgi:hypothetical protein